MKTIITFLSFLFIGMAVAVAQDSSGVHDRVDSLKNQIKEKQKILAETARNIADMAQEIHTKSASDHEKKMYRKYEEEYRELREKILEIEKELFKEEVGLKEKPDDLIIQVKRRKSQNNDVKTRWGVVDFGFSTYSYSDDVPDLDGINPVEKDLMSSISWRLHIMNQKVNIYRHKLNFIYGFGFEFDSYGWSYPVTLKAMAPEVEFSLPDNNRLTFKKNKLRSTFLHVPVMFNYEANKFHFDAGMYGNVLLKAKTTQKTNEYKAKIKDQFNINNFQYGIIAQVGYGPITFYGTMGLNEFFKTLRDGGYELMPYSFGIKLIPF